MESSSFSFNPTVKTGMRTFLTRTLESSNVMEYSRSFPKSTSTASNSTACFAFPRSPMSSFLTFKNALPSPTRLP